MSFPTTMFTSTPAMGTSPASLIPSPLASRYLKPPMVMVTNVLLWPHVPSGFGRDPSGHSSGQTPSTGGDPSGQTSGVFRTLKLSVFAQLLRKLMIAPFVVRPEQPASINHA